MFAFPDLPKRKEDVFEVFQGNLGLYIGTSPLAIPAKATPNCNNVRLRDGKITNEKIGYELFMTLGLTDQVLLIDSFVQSTGAAITIFGTRRDLYQYDSGSNEPKFITPIHTTGTASITNGTKNVAGAGTPLWDTGTPKNAKAGDFIHFTSATQVDVDAVWYEIASVTDDDNLVLVENLAEATHTTVVYTIRQTFTATDADFWDTDVFPDAPQGDETSMAAGDHWFATNGSEIVVWDGNLARVLVLATAATGLAITCKTLTYYKNMMLYGNLLEAGSLKSAHFKNSAIADPEKISGLDANEFVALEGIDFIEAMIPMGDMVVVYGTNAIAVIQFVNVPVFFAIRTVTPGIGVYSGRMVMDYGDYHEFLSNDKAYRFDGVRLLPIGDQVFPEILRQADRGRSHKSLVFISEEELEVYWVVALAADPGTGTEKSATVAWTQHYAEQVGNSPVPYMRRDLPVTAAGTFTDANLGRFSDFTEGFHELQFPFGSSFFTSEFPVILIGDENGFIWRMNTVSKQGANAELESFVESPVRPLTEGRGVGIIRRIEPHLTKFPTSTALTVESRSFNRVGADPLIGNEGDVEVDHSNLRYKPNRQSGRYGQVKFSSSLLTSIWAMEGYRVETEELGDR